MKQSILIPAALMLLCNALIAADKPSKPNIIVIYTDDHGYADLGCQGIMKDLKTPNLDALAASGVRMTEGYVTAPQCGPSRAGLISGRYQNRFGMEANGYFEKEKDVLQRFRELKTLPDRMKEAGYVTGMAGKSHLGSDDSAELVKLGFDKVFFKHSDGPGSWNMDLTGKDIPPQVQKGGAYHLEAITTFACTFIERFKDKPFFFYLAYRAPHVPLDAPKKYIDRFPGEMPERRRKALASISCVDDGVGRIMATLRKDGLEENTLVFVISDNGAPLKMTKPDEPGGGPGWDGSLNDPMNGEKGMLTEGGIRTPFLVRWKGTIPGGQVYPHPVISLDVAATANNLAGLPDDPALDGVNLMPYLKGEKSTAPHDALYWRWLGQSAIRKGDWKYIRSDDREYLFNIRNDAEEKHDQLATHPEIVKELHAQLGEWAGTLSPPGIWALKSEAMSKGAAAHFDYYFEGKKSAAEPQEKAAKKNGKTTSEDASMLQFFEHRDSNKDDKVSLTEFIAGRTGDTVKKLEIRFHKLDGDGNGTWDRTEVK